MHLEVGVIELFNKVKNSLILQINFLFLISIIFIILLWSFFYYSQKHQEKEHNIARYFNVVTTIQPLIIKKESISQNDLSILGMKKITGIDKKNFKKILEKKNNKKGFTIFKYKDKKVLYLYNSIGDLYLEDIHTDQNIYLIHIVFILLLIAQIFLYLKLTNSLNPLSLLSNKLKNLEQGDRTPLNIKSNYEEINQIINSYNASISKIDYMLEVKEMFNKIFMHEMKTPLAKGMFYLKQEPSQNTHEKLLSILKGINDELEEFSQIESLIAYQNNIDKTEHSFLDILQISKQRANIEDENIITKNIDGCKLVGDKEFWILCIKNILDNGIKYSQDKKIIIEYEKAIVFKNIGDALPVDISSDIKQWKIDKNKRHKSSTGYGFGLFIIKNIVILHGYELIYTYDNLKKEIKLEIR